MEEQESWSLQPFMGWQEKVGGERQEREAWWSQLKVGTHPGSAGEPLFKESNDTDNGVKVIENSALSLWSKSRVKIPTFKDATIEQTWYQMNNVTRVILDAFLHFCVSDFKTLFFKQHESHHFL